MSQETRRLGRWGERLAADYLCAQGWELLESNARTHYGELDLVLRTPTKVIVFVEVKTRRSTAFGLPEASITPVKRRHLLNSAQAYLLAHPAIGVDWRVDVIAILRLAGQTPQITHFENAISA